MWYDVCTCVFSYRKTWSTPSARVLLWELQDSSSGETWTWPRPGWVSYVLLWKKICCQTYFCSNSCHWDRWTLMSVNVHVKNTLFSSFFICFGSKQTTALNIATQWKADIMWSFCVVKPLWNFEIYNAHVSTGCSDHVCMEISSKQDPMIITTKISGGVIFRNVQSFL